jgi:hypothetical protein
MMKMKSLKEYSTEALIKRVSDNLLIEELRKRGYVVTKEKVIDRSELLEALKRMSVVMTSEDNSKGVNPAVAAAIDSGFNLCAKTLTALIEKGNFDGGEE